MDKFVSSKTLLYLTQAFRLGVITCGLIGFSQSAVMIIYFARNLWLKPNASAFNAQA
jgi:hypothetical protein